MLTVICNMLTLSSLEARAQDDGEAAAVRRPQPRVLVAGVLQDAGPAEQHVRLVALDGQPAFAPAPDMISVNQASTTAVRPKHVQTPRAACGIIVSSDVPPDARMVYTH